MAKRRERFPTRLNYRHRPAGDRLRGGVEQDVTVFDVSRNGDWTRVKVWYRDSQGLGSSEYPTHGFIYGPRPAAGLSSAHPDYVGSLIDAYAR